MNQICVIRRASAVQLIPLCISLLALAKVVYAQSQQPLWEQYMGTCEQSGQKFDISKSNQYHPSCHKS